MSAPDPRHHDLLIIGSGSGNSVVTPELEHLDIAIAEHGVFGGTCLNVGCIPTKMFVYPADIVATAVGAGRLGLDFAAPTVDWPAIRDRIFSRIDPISAAGERYRADDEGITLYRSTARFVAEKTLDIGGHVVTADRIVVAAGARPMMLDVPGLDRVDPGRGVHTSDTIMRVDAVPRRLAVIGSGFIAAEMAHVFASLGAAVSIVARGEALLRHHEEEISARYTQQAVSRYDVRLSVQVQAAEHTGGQWRLRLSDGSTVQADAVLVAIGRRPNADLVDATAGGLVVDDHGHIVVDEYQRTCVPGVFALGDISNHWQLKHVANHEARVVAHNLAHPADLVAADHRFVPHGVFGYPQIASFGPTGRELQRKGIPHVVKTQAFGDVAYGWAMEDTTGFLTLYADPQSGQVLAAHAIGYQASMVIQPLLMAASFGISAHDAARGQYWPHPALTEVAENALLGLDYGK